MRANKPLGRTVCWPSGRCHLRAEEKVGHRGRHRPREKIGSHHGKDDGECERREEVVGDALKKENRHEDDANAERGDESGNRDLVRAIQDRLDHALAEAHVPVDIFNRHRGIIHQECRRQGPVPPGS